MWSVALANGKGGVGKTTLSIILAQESLMTGYKTICIDLDPQKNFQDAMRLYSARPENEKYLKGLSVHGPMEVIDIPDDGPDTLVVVDCPPALQDMTLMGMKTAQKIIVPVMSDIFSILNLGVVYDLAQKCGKSHDDVSLVSIGFQQSGLTLPPALLNEINSNKYYLLGDLPLSRFIPTNIAVGKMWATGMPMGKRHPFYKLLKYITEV